MVGRQQPYGSVHASSKVVGLVLALIFACFSLSSTSYLAWLYRLLEVAPQASVESVTMVGAYAFQALGIAMTSATMRRWPAVTGKMPFVAAIAIHFACTALALGARSLTALIACGYAMNVTCGIVSAFYLQRLSCWVPSNHRALAFGGGYACSVATTWVLTLLQDGSPLGTAESLAACAALSLVAVALIAASRGIEEAPDEGSNAAGNVPDSAAPSPPAPPIPTRTLLLACATVLLMSLVKSAGFGFPTSDLEEGVSLEFSRLLYALGLLVAGLIADADRRHAALSCVAALFFPLVCLALAREPISGTILWALNYLFFGFFSVWRVVVFCDIAHDAGHEHLFGLGLACGRIGDALGTAVFLALANSTVALTALSAALSAITVFVFSALFGQLYLANPTPAKSKEELLTQFALAHDLTARERDVLRLVLAGRTNAEVASDLFVTEGTVKYHVHNLFRKTSCTSRRELLATFAEETA